MRALKMKNDPRPGRSSHLLRGEVNQYVFILPRRTKNIQIKELLAEPYCIECADKLSNTDRINGLCNKCAEKEGIN